MKKTSCHVTIITYTFICLGRIPTSEIPGLKEKKHTRAHVHTYTQKNQQLACDVLVIAVGPLPSQAFL